MMRRLLVLLSLLILAAVQPAHSAPLKLGVLPAADTIVLHVAADEGLFAKQGLEVELVPFQSALELGAAMRAGALSGHFGDIINVLMQNESGSPQAIVATTSHSSPDNRCFGLVVSPKSKAQTLADLKGKDIAVSSATIIDFLLAQLLLQEGAAPDFLNRQDIRQIPVRLQMLLSGQIESALLPEPLVSLVEAKGARTILNDCKLNTPLAVIALKLKEVFGLDDINDLPIVYNIAWYEQKAVIVLLALLYLGVKNIHLGPTLPAFLSPNVAKVLVENFGIAGIGTVEEDLKLFFPEA